MINTLPSDHHSNDQFNTTHWSIVLAAKEGDSPAAQEALERLCQAYWYPLYAFVRRQGYSLEDAQDLIQGYFERVIAKKYFAEVNQSKGRFRAFLLASLKHFLSDERKKEHAAKRGGGVTIIYLDALTAEERYQLEPVDTMTPDRLFDRVWASTVIDHAVARLRQKYITDCKSELYEYLKTQLVGSAKGMSYAEIARRTGKTENAVKSEAKRMRERFRQFVREEIQNTVAGVPDIDEEMCYLLEV